MNYLGIDLGATSGRAIVGALDGRRITLQDIHRFPNDPLLVGDRLHWDIPYLLHEVKHGLRKASAETGGDISSFGIDSWGLDFGLLDRGGELVCLPFHHRDHTWPTAISNVENQVGRSELYRRTGIQFMPVNTVYQLASIAASGSGLLDRAEHLLMIPDLLSALLTGDRIQEYTNATTTQCVDVTTNCWDTDLLTTLDVPTRLFVPLTPPPLLAGRLSRSVRAETGLGAIPATVIASHDTASAFVAVPAEGRFAVLSCGTWSLLGTETSEPVLTNASRDANFSNEGGVFGTVRLLRNIMGLWLAESCRREWAGAGKPLGHEQILGWAATALPHRSLIDPDHPSFLNPASMTAAIRERCRVTGEPVLEDAGSLFRCLYESLALKYRMALERLEMVVGHRFDGLHIVGGGARNHLLCQFTANAISRPVWAGPVEATVIGNVAMQAVAAGELDGLSEIRTIVRESFPTETYTPRDSGAWDETWDRFRNLVARRDEEHGGWIV